jgi:hypothetical protein
MVADTATTHVLASPETIAAALDGQPGRELRRLVPLMMRRADGAFFTGSALAKRVVSKYLRSASPDATVCDPACGAGDLLIAAAARLPVLPDLRDTLELWSRSLRGFDIHEEFVEAARLRLVLAAVARGARARKSTPKQLAALLSHIRVADGTRVDFRDVNVVLMNPPYGTKPAPSTCAWASGSVSDAAVFTHELLERTPFSTKVVAILPDVLRTGSRYAKWRHEIEQRLIVDGINVVGIFDNWADVDVFVLHGRKRKAILADAPSAQWWAPAAAGARLSDLYDVHVGAVVPHRDPKVGPWRKYVHARTISNVDKFDIAAGPSRRFDRRTFRPPFVVVRRTSRPDDQIRAVGTIVIGDEDVAVENHLLVVSPRLGTIGECETLLDVLKRESTTQWLNERIRCRHLTVGAVAAIPWPTVKNDTTTSPICD